MPPQIALQLYTLRDALAEDFPGTLARIAQIGYRAVETAFLPEHITVTTAASQNDGIQVFVTVHRQRPLCPGADWANTKTNRMKKIGTPTQI